MNSHRPGSRVVFVNRYYWPEEPATAQLLTDLAEGLATRGWQTRVITSHDGSRATPQREQRHGVEITRIRATRWGRRGITAKAFDYLTFSLAARHALRRQVEAGDWLVAMTDPPSLALIAATVARRAQARLVHWVQDIHPEIDLALSPNRLLAALARRWMPRRDTAWQTAEACVAISRDMASLIAEHGVPAGRLQTIPNWAPGDIAPIFPAPGPNVLRGEWGVTDQFVVAYSGNLGRVHALEPVLGAAALLRADPGLVFLLIGDGPRRRALGEEARARGLGNVRFLPSQPRARLAESLSAADVHLVTLRAGCERLVFPSKLYGIAAVGRPVAYLGPLQCEVAETIRRGDFGVTVGDHDSVGLADALRRLKDDPPRLTALGEAAARWSRATGGLRAALEAWTGVLHDA